MPCPVCDSCFIELLQPCPKFFQMKVQTKPIPVEHYRCKNCNAEWVKTGAGKCHIFADTMLRQEAEAK